MPPSRSPDEIHIIGAGIAGLALARILAHRNIPFHLFERRSPTAEHRYGVTLHPEAYTPFLRAIGTPEPVFLRAVAARPPTAPLPTQPPWPTFRARRDKLERFLLGETPVTRSALKALEPTTDAYGRPALTLRFEPSAHAPAEEVTSTLTVGADGEHSTVRQALLPDTAPITVLPYAVYHFRRTVPDAVYRAIYAPALALAQLADPHTKILSHYTGAARLQVECIANATPATWTIRSTYSRRAHACAPADALYTPQRTPSEAQRVPTRALSAELATLRTPALPTVFAHAFDPELAGGGASVLNWLMRSVSVPGPELAGLASRGVVLVGNAAHAEPILGGRGANAALLDAVELAEVIVQGYGVAAFYEAAAGRWRRGVLGAERGIARLHEGREGGVWEGGPEAGRYDGFKVLEGRGGKM